MLRFVGAHHEVPRTVLLACKGWEAENVSQLVCV
jgi:hypothetical protein